VQRYADYDMLLSALRDYYWQELPLADKNEGDHEMKFGKFLKSLFVERLWLKAVCLVLALFAVMMLNIM